MGNSTRTIQAIVDSVSTIGDLSPVLTNTGGFAAEPALTITYAAMTDLISSRFNWKWNRVKVPGFLLTSNQQDYASVNLQNVGWLESALVVDVNNTSNPKPVRPVATVRDLDITDFQASPPAEVSWMGNSLLEFAAWPGAGIAYVNPLGALTTPANPPTNILDSAGNILVLAVYGVTGTTAPVATDLTPGANVADGTCVWQVANPAAVGFRVSPCPPQAGNVWLMRVFAQGSVPPRPTSLAQTIDPIPDDYSKWFEDGFIAYAHRHSANPSVQAKFEQKRAEWIEAIMGAVKQGDREDESKSFFPDRPVMDGRYNYGPTVGNPMNMRRW